MSTQEKAQRKSLFPFYWRNPAQWLSHDFADLWSSEAPETVPAVNIREERDHFKIEVAAPGLRKDDFAIHVEENVLTISSKKAPPPQEGPTDGSYVSREYDYSNFSRSLAMPDEADSDQIQAKYSDGVLQVTIPKRKKAVSESSHKITVD